MSVENTLERIHQLAERAVALGAFKAGAVAVEQIPFDAGLRRACEANFCGNYGRNWTCPPDVGDVNELIAEARSCCYALVYQTVSTIEDSFDYEGMVAALERHRQITEKITGEVKQCAGDGVLQLSAGGCILCDTCAKRENLPCRHPEKAVASLEAYGIYVAKLAALAGMKYINGKNTVTYFGAYLFK